MGHHLLLRSVGLGPPVAVRVRHCPRVISGLIVVALDVEDEVAYQPSGLVVGTLKIGAMVDVAEI